VSTQVFQYIEDIQTCLTELFRVLKPGGRALILCTDWDTLIWNTDDQDRMHRILSAFEAHCADPQLPRTIVNRILDAGFNIVEQDVYTVLNPKYDANTYCYGVIDFIVTYVSEVNEEMTIEAKAWAEEMRKRGEDNSYFCSINRYIFLMTKSA
jgi:SAM-dependent methyltransferase